MKQRIQKPSSAKADPDDPGIVLFQGEKSGPKTWLKLIFLRPRQMRAQCVTTIVNTMERQGLS